MSDEQTPGAAFTLTLKWTDYASKNLNARIAELKRRDQRIQSDAMVDGIQFLRGVGSRASQVLPAFYLLTGSGTPPKPATEVPPWKPTQAAMLDHLALQSISLSCRAIFDETTKRRLTGKRFAHSSDRTLSAIAAYWSKVSKRPEEDAIKALTLLRDLFRLCAQPKRLLLEGKSLLERRVGLLKYHADRAPAHITLDPFVVDLCDIIHVVAAISVVGAIIVDFDPPRPARPNLKYFNSLDEAGWNAAKAIFPDLAMDRLFVRFAIHEQAQGYWKHPEYGGLKMLTSGLPAAIGHWDSKDEAVASEETRSPW